MQTRVHAPLRYWLGSLRKHVSLITLHCFAVVASAQPSLFDSSFSVGLGTDRDVYSVMVQNDGRIIIGGFFDNVAGQPYSMLARLNTNGTLDSTFSSGTDRTVYRLLQQPDGNILVAGNFTTLQGVARQKIGRILPSGITDPTFDPGTLVESNNIALTLANQLDGKILVSTVLEENDSRLFRLHTNGLPDEAFFQTNVFSNGFVYALQIRTNGSILVGGVFSSVNGFPSSGLALLSSNGIVNTNFTSPLDNNSIVFSLIEQTNGVILVGGVLKRSGVEHVIARLTSNLVWDTNFNADRFELDDPFAPYRVAAVRSAVLQPDGKIVAGGTFQKVGGYWRRNVVRLDSEGRVDPCFDPGLGLIETYEFLAGASCLARQNDGRILVSGGFFSIDGHDSRNIARLLPQSDCNATRIHLSPNTPVPGVCRVASTSPPGVTNCLQVSTNLVDWENFWISSEPYLYFDCEFSRFPSAFFRIKEAN